MKLTETVEYNCPKSLLRVLMLGQTISRCKILQKPGERGMSFVHKSRGQRPQAARRAEVPHHQSSRRPGHQGRFQSEDETSAAFNRTNVETRSGEIHIHSGRTSRQPMSPAQ